MTAAYFNLSMRYSVH